MSFFSYSFLRFRRFIHYCARVSFHVPRSVECWLLSDCAMIQGFPIRNQACLLLGLGKITFGKNVNLGVWPSPFFLSGYIHLEARSRFSTVSLGNNVWINNNAVLISDGPGIFVGDNTLIGHNFFVSDSDFHDLSPEKRFGGTPKTGEVVISENVFIGSGVTVLKGVRIGKNSVVGCGSVVTKSFGENLIIAGNPARVIKKL